MTNILELPPTEFRTFIESRGIDLGDGEHTAYCKYSEQLNLNALAIGLDIDDVTYYPEELPLLYYESEWANVLLSGDGYCIVPAAQSKQHAEETLVGVAGDMGEYEGMLENPMSKDIEPKTDTETIPLPHDATLMYDGELY